MFFQVIIALGIVIIVGMVIVSVRYNKKRIERLNKYARSKGGSFSFRDANLKEKIKCFHHPRETVSVENIVNLSDGPFNIYLFDYWTGTAAQGRNTRSMVTACLIEGKLRFESTLEVWTKIPGLSRLFGGRNQIVQPGREEFNKKYLVISPNRAFVSKVLSEEVQELFLQHKRTKNWMLIFKLVENKIFVSSNMLHLKTSKDWDDIIELGKNLWRGLSRLYKGN